MFERFKRIVQWKRAKRKQRIPLTADDPGSPGTGSAPSLISPSGESSPLLPAPDCPARPSSTPLAIDTFQGMNEGSFTPMIRTEPPPNYGDPIHLQPQALPIKNNLSYSVSPVVTMSVPNTDRDLSKNYSESASNKPALITRTLKAVLTTLGELAGAPMIVNFTESLDRDERDCSTRKDLEAYSDRLLGAIKLVMEKGESHAPQALRDNLQRLNSKLTVTREEIRNHNVPVDVGGIARRITDMLQVFMFESYLEGLITRPHLYNRMEKHVLIQSIRELPRAKAAYDDYTRDKQRVSCFQGTREALLQEITKWLSAWDDSRAYLLFGIAGIGKSTVAQTVAQKVDDLGCLGASFFFSRDEADRRTAEKFFTTLAFQLCVYDEEFAQAIGTALTEKQGAAATTKEPQEQLRMLIVEPLQQFKKSRLLPIAIVVDALDECNTEDGPKILMGLDQLVRELPFFKVILTTRPQPHLQHLLDRLGEHKIFHLQNIEETVVGSDIRLYLGHCFSPDQVHTRLPMLRRKWTANDTDIASLVRAAGRLFIIASTAVLYVLDKAACNPGSRMKTLQDEFTRNRTPFNTLNDFYTVILRSAVPLGCERDIVERYQLVVGTIVLIEDPLPVGALSTLIDIPEDDVYYVLDNLQSVISLGNNDVPLVYHKSFPDYVTDDRRCQDADMRITPRDHHTRLASCCLRIMNTHLKRNTFNLSGPAQYFDNEKAFTEEKLSKDDIQRAIPSAVQYASVHWASHVTQADLKDRHLTTEIKTFVEKHLLHWLETLSWIRKIGIAYLSLKLQIANSDIRQIVSDVLRFVSRDYEKIERSALYVYHSALPFAPTGSLLYQKYKQETLSCQVHGGPARWNVQISENQHGNYVFRTAFAKDSSLFASWALTNVKLWDATSGTPIRTFDGYHITLADDFSVLAVPQESLVTVYIISTSAPITSFNHSAKVVKIAISFDGSRLASGLESGIVDVWDVAKGAPIAHLRDYDGSHLAFTLSGHMLAFMSKGAISLWNGVDVSRLEHEYEKPINFAFFGNDTQLATIARKDEKDVELKTYNLRLWNSESKKLIAVARDVGEQLAVSPANDGSLIATGGWEKKVQLWRGDSFDLIDPQLPTKKISSLALSSNMLAIGSWTDHTVTLHYIEKLGSTVAKLQIFKPTFLGFSPDDTRCAAGSSGGAVHLWDVQNIKASVPTSNQQLRLVTALAFSLDCSRLASGREDGGIELWDTGDITQPIASRMHSGRIGALAFSPDGKQLASGSTATNSVTVKFWDGRDGQSSDSTVVYLDGVGLTSLAFSNILLAAATKTTITIMDRISQRRIRTFTQGSNSLSFSLDGSMLASSHTPLAMFSGVTVWNTEKLEVVATFDVSENIIAIFPSPDGSKLAAQYKTHNLMDETVGFKFFDIVNKVVISDPENDDFSLVPHLNGVPTWLKGDRLLGRFSAHHDSVPMLWIPREFGVREFANQSSMLALGCENGRILLIVPSASH